MPVAVGISLEKDGVRSILQGVSGNGKGFDEVWEVEDGARQEELFELIKGSLASGSPVPTIVFLSEVEEGVDDSGVVRYEPSVEVGKAQEGLHVLDFGESRPGSDAIKFDWVYSKLTRFHNHSKVFNFWDVKLAFSSFR